MAIQEKDMELLERYLEDGLNADEKKVFEVQLAINAELKAEYQNRIYLRKLWLDSLEYEETKATIKSAITQQTKSSKTRQLWIAVSIAASIIILLGIYFLNNHNQSIKEIESQKQYSKENQGFQDVQEDQPPSYAAIDSLSIVKLIEPVDQQKIKDDSDFVFKWSSKSSLLDTLSVYETRNDSLRLQIPIQLSDSIVNIPASRLGNGNYYWKLKTSNEKGEFIIY